MGCKRLSTLGGSDCGMDTSGTGRQAHGGGGGYFHPCIFPFTFLPVYGGATSATLLAAAARMVCIQAGRKGGRTGSLFDVLLPLYFPINIFPGCVGDRECKRCSTLGGSAYDTHSSGVGELAREDVLGGAVYFSIYVTGSLIG